MGSLVVVGRGFSWYTHKTMMFVESNVSTDFNCSICRIPKSVDLLCVAVANENATNALWVQLSSSAFGMWMKAIEPKTRRCDKLRCQSSKGVTGETLLKTRLSV